MDCLLGKQVKNFYVGKDHVGDVPLSKKILAALTTGECLLRCSVFVITLLKSLDSGAFISIRTGNISSMFGLSIACVLFFLVLVFLLFVLSIYLK